MTESLAFGPMTATVSPPRFNGSTRCLFSNNVMDSRAIRSASESCAAEATTEKGILVHDTLSGSFISPKSKRAFSNRLTDLSMTFSSICFFRAASTSDSYVEPHSRSVPLRTAAEAAEGASLCVRCPFSSKKSLMAQQSLKMMPSNPHSSRRICVSRRLLPQQGSPSKRLYAHITSFTPASCTRALKAGK